jgi:hypothetical protein
VFRPLILCTAALLLASPLSAQAARLVDPLDPAYRDLELLADAGLVRLSLAQRPLSRAAIHRALAEATRTLEERSVRDTSVGGSRRAAFFRELITSLRERLDLSDSALVRGRLASRLAPLRSAVIDLERTDEPTRRISESNGIGEIDAFLNTLLTDRQGRPLVGGSNGFVETNHTLESDRIAISATPEILFAAPTGDAPNRTSVRLQELQFRTVFGNLAVDIGREYVVWGQGRDVGLLNSNNSPPLNLLKLSSEEPFLFPWVLRGLGPARAAIYYTDLGADQNFPHAYSIGYQLNVVPTSHLELGVSVYTKSGGHGAPRGTATARIIDLLPFLDASAYNNVIGTRGKFEFSDHYAGFQGRLRFPSVGSSVFWELLLNDFDVRRLESVLWEDAGHVVGVDLPPLTKSGRLRASLEYHHTGIRYYEHHQFISGQTIHQTLTGDPLGPDAQGAYANIDWYAAVRRRLGIQLALERRSNDQYIFIPEPFGFRKGEVRPKEWQARLLANWQLIPEQRQLGVLLQGGYERTRNFDFVAAADRNGVLGRVQLEYRFQ